MQEVVVGKYLGTAAVFRLVNALYDCHIFDIFLLGFAFNLAFSLLAKYRKTITIESSLAGVAGACCGHLIFIDGFQTTFSVDIKKSSSDVDSFTIIILFRSCCFSRVHQPHNPARGIPEHFVWDILSLCPIPVDDRIVF